MHNVRHRGRVHRRLRLPQARPDVLRKADETQGGKKAGQQGPQEGRLTMVRGRVDSDEKGDDSFRQGVINRVGGGR